VNKTIYSALPMPHGRVQRVATPVKTTQGRLPADLAEKITQRGGAELLLLPREVDPLMQDGDPSLALYTDVDQAAVRGLQRVGASVDFLTEHRKVVAQFAEITWIDFAVAVAANVSTATVFGMARYLAMRVRAGKNSQKECGLDLVAGFEDGSFFRATGADGDRVLSAWYTELATKAAEPAARKALLDLATAADASRSPRSNADVQPRTDTN